MNQILSIAKTALTRLVGSVPSRPLKPPKVNFPITSVAEAVRWYLYNIGLDYDEMSDEERRRWDAILTPHKDQSDFLIERDGVVCSRVSHDGEIRD